MEALPKTYITIFIFSSFYKTHISMVRNNLVQLLWCIKNIEHLAYNTAKVRALLTSPVQMAVKVRHLMS